MKESATTAGLASLAALSDAERLRALGDQLKMVEELRGKKRSAAPARSERGLY